VLWVGVAKKRAVIVDKSGHRLSRAWRAVKFGGHAALVVIGGLKNCVPMRRGGAMRRRRRPRWNASALPERGNPAIRHRGRARAGNRAVLAATLPRQSHRPPPSRGVEVGRKRRLAKWLRTLGASGGQEESGQQVGGGGEQVTSGVEGHAFGLQGRLGRAIRQAALVG